MFIYIALHNMLRYIILFYYIIFKKVMTQKVCLVMIALWASFWLTTTARQFVTQRISN